MQPAGNRASPPRDGLASSTLSFIDTGTRYDQFGFETGGLSTAPQQPPPLPPKLPPKPTALLASYPTSSSSQQQLPGFPPSFPVILQQQSSPTELSFSALRQQRPAGSSQATELAPMDSSAPLASALSTTMNGISKMDLEYPTEETEAQKLAARSRPWNINWWRRWFDVDTGDVAKRVLLSMYPIRTTFIVDNRPRTDLYGPFWITLSLTFVTAVVANFDNWARSGISAVDWEYDPMALLIAASSLGLYVTVIPLIEWLLIKYGCSEERISLIDLICIYGYSLFIFIPALVICMAPNDIVQWVMVFVPFGVSVSFLLSNLAAALRNSSMNLVQILSVLFIVFACHTGLACLFRLFFLEYKNPNIPGTDPYNPRPSNP